MKKWADTVPSLRWTNIYHKQAGDIAKLTSSIMPTLGIIDASIILHSLIALLHCIVFLDKGQVLQKK